MRGFWALLPLSLLAGCSQISNKKSTRGVAVADEVGRLSSEIDDDPPERQEQNTGDIVLFDVYGINSDLHHQDLIGGSIPNPQDWPASFASNQSGSGCTATLLSKDVLQLAAHCVGNGRTASITIDGRAYTGTCNHHPNYKSDETADYALCKMSTPVDRTWYEKVLTDETKIKVGTKITLAGAGCTSRGNGSFGTFRTGESNVVSLPVRDNDTVTRGGAALCFGDSGGSAFYVEGKDRWVMGVNSRGNISDTSYLSSVFTSAAKSWYQSWASVNKVSICGINSWAEKCQSGGPAPSPSPSPTPSPSPSPEGPIPAHCLASYQYTFKCIWGTPRLALTQAEECRQAVANLFACEEIAERAED